MSLQKNEFINKVSVIVLCAGEGHRFGKLTKDLPKPLLRIKSIGNKSILEIILNMLNYFKIKKVAIVKGYFGDKLDEFYKELLKKKVNVPSEIFLIDSYEEYKKGPIFSFLSVINDKKFLIKKEIYIIIPGDTIFSYELITLIMKSLSNSLDIIKNFPIIFYRTIKANELKKYNYLLLKSDSKRISIIKTVIHNSHEYLEEIIKNDLKKIDSFRQLKQIIPLFVIDYKFFNIIKEIQKKINARTIHEILNYMCKRNRKIIAIETGFKSYFFDLDNKYDLIYFNNLLEKKKDNSSSEFLEYTSFWKYP
ncbi:MAG: NTP transferase domain-containing protein [Promethearchaeota archaeon]